MVTESDRFRIAVALTALKFKPLDQSFMAYASELRSQFPSTSTELAFVDFWRSLALKLEHDIQVLKEKYEAEQIRTSALESGVMSGSSLSAPNSSLEQPVTSKKKPKKKPGPTTTSCSENTMRKLPIPRPDLKAILEDLSLRNMSMSWVQSQHSLFSTLDSFMQLTALPEARLDLLTSVTLRAVNAIAKQICDIISPLVPSGSSDSDTLNCLGIALHHVLAESLPPLEQVLPQTAEPIVAILDRTTRLILLPLVHAFYARSETYLGSLFLPPSVGLTDKILEPSASSHRSLSLDIRVDMLDLFRKIFCLLDGRLQSFATSSVSHTFRASLILETIRELDRVLSVVPAANTSHDPNGGVDIHDKRYRRTRPDRVKRLAKKDSLWYLCTVLHLLLCESSSVGASQPETVPVISQGTCEKDALTDNFQGARLLSKGISDALFQLVTRCNRPLPSSLQSQTSKVEIKTPRGRVEFEHTRSQGGLECVEECRTAGFRGWDNGDIDRHENCVRMFKDNRNAGVQVDNSVDATGSDQPVGSASQGAKLYDHDHGSKIELDEVGYGMLLGVLERYWVWSRSWEF
ncbi:hypothetical protein E4T56_gene3081 [Termitomyces sp. T112]|nr:hypothetical protein E4T56_gene3081 [Termitomyces sp. T112]KAH0590151.1 hypothetical protein H2248_000326 [Termitomyces sp. 'cryptogamus']